MLFCKSGWQKRGIVEKVNDSLTIINNDEKTFTHNREYAIVDKDKTKADRSGIPLSIGSFTEKKPR